MKITLQQIADAVGVSKMTVSLYLRDKSTTRVSSKLKKQIEDAITSLGYVPPVSSGSDSSNRVIGIYIPFAHPFFKYELVNTYLIGIQQELVSRNYNMMFLNRQNSHDGVLVDKKTLDLAKKCRGIIIFGTRETTKASLQGLVDIFNKNDIPVTVLNFPSRIDNALQGFTVNDTNCNPVQYLISLGHKRILFMGGSFDAFHTQEKIDEYRTTLSTNGIEVSDELIVEGDFESYSAYTALKRKMADGVKFTSVYCISTQMCVGCYRALHEGGYRIPEDVSVINYGDPYFIEFLNPALTAVYLPLEELGRSLTAKFVGLIEKGRKHITGEVVIPNKLSVRNSTSSIR